MMRALYSSVSGLKTHQTKMDVIGNNIANVNTVGFKSSRTTFSTMMYQNMSFASGANVQTGKGGVNAKQIGLGATFASTAVDIDTGGASESTGKAFDLKLSDKNSTSFYIVNTGTENVFTRAGAFYVDGAGNLCMESTGYQVMGWQVDANGNIRKDTVTPLRIMSPENQTSNPEYTTKAMCTGILDDNSSNVNSDKGYAMNLTFYDNLGYSYTAKFAAQKIGDPKNGRYSINLADIIDSNGKSILSNDTIGLGDLFGGGQGSCVDITDSYKVADGMGNSLGALANQTADPTDQTLLYNYTSDYINEILGPDEKTNRLPSGLTVQIKINPNANPLGNPTQIKVFDSSGAEFNIADPKYASWISPNNSNNIQKVTNAKDEIKKMIDSGQLSKSEAAPTKYVIDGKTLQTLALKYKDDPNSGITDTTLPAGDPKAEITLDANGEVTTIVWNPAQTATGILNPSQLVTATRTDVLTNYLSQGYINVSATAANNLGVFTTELPVDAEIRYVPGEKGAWSYTVVTPAKDGYEIQFSTADGSLTYIGSDGNKSQTLRLSNYRTEGNQFSDIEIDFSTLKNLSNGGSSTGAMSPGNAGEGEGKRVGAMIGLSVDQSGMIYGSYSNGNTTLLGQIAVARFANASGLESIGENCYRTTMNSGQFDGIGVEMDSDGSTIDSGTLEMSNVDLATEFTMMITTQRGYQANSRVISTSDSILEELVNLKR